MNKQNKCCDKCKATHFKEYNTNIVTELSEPSCYNPSCECHKPTRCCDKCATPIGSPLTGFNWGCSNPSCECHKPEEPKDWEEKLYLLDETANWGRITPFIRALFFGLAEEIEGLSWTKYPESDRLISLDKALNIINKYIK